MEEKLPTEERDMYFLGLAKGEEERQRLRKRRTERDFDLGEKKQRTPLGAILG